VINISSRDITTTRSSSFLMHQNIPTLNDQPRGSFDRNRKNGKKIYPLKDCNVNPVLAVTFAQLLELDQTPCYSVYDQPSKCLTFRVYLFYHITVHNIYIYITIYKYEQTTTISDENIARNNCRSFKGYIYSGFEYC